MFCSFLKKVKVLFNPIQVFFTKLVSTNFIPVPLDLSSGLHGFENLETLVVYSRGGLTIAALRGVTLQDSYVALPRYIVYLILYHGCRIPLRDNGNDLNHQPITEPTINSNLSRF